MTKRVFIIVLDSLGIGELPDSDKFGDKGSNTLKAIRQSKNFNAKTLKELGLFNIDGVGGGIANPLGSYARLAEKSSGKDTTTGHWEIAGLISEKPMPTYPDGFPDEIIKPFEKLTGKKALCNKPYSGTEVIKDYGEEHLKTPSLIVYTSADSVFQIASHISVVPTEELYEYCEIARKLLVGEHGVGRVIARPFEGEYPFSRTSGRHDYSIEPPKKTMLDAIYQAGKSVISVGKIADIFANRSISKGYRTSSNAEGMRIATELLSEDFNGLCFVNLVDFDTVYGHRNDIDGYAKAIAEFDNDLKTFVKQLKSDDILIITADHGCDPSTPSTDHSREYTPMVIFGAKVKSNFNLGTRNSFADISATVCEALGVDGAGLFGESFFNKIKITD